LQQSQKTLKEGRYKKWFQLIKQINSGIRIRSLKRCATMSVPCAAGIGVGFLDGIGKNEIFSKQI